MTSQVALIMPGEQHGNRDIVLETKTGTFKKNSETNRAYDSLQYPILFPRGEDSYHFELQQTDPNTGELTTKNVSALDFYSYRIMMRTSGFNIRGNIRGQ